MRDLRCLAVLGVLLSVPFLVRADEPENLSGTPVPCSVWKVCDGVAYSVPQPSSAEAGVGSKACGQPVKYRFWPLPWIRKEAYGCCPDDYCRKPLPCPPSCARCGCVDDYCRKPLPCPPSCARCGCVDDYCRKPLPCPPSPACGPGYLCGPPPGPGCNGGK